ncbi:hypothetical protein A4G19_10115 [Pasteurellaceae bacterium Macca]|nr:hypothetical protein [Pasteurellaceae bacterium Macca]
MLIHNSIRNEVIERLAENMPDVKHYHNGLPRIYQGDSVLPMIAVYLNDAEGRPVRFGDGGIDWFAELNILTCFFREGEAT